MELNYAVEGDGESLVFIHGLSDNLLYWEALATALRREFKVVRFDLRGHGKSPLGDEEITIDTYANDLKSLLDELDITKTNLIGFSLGGAVAMDFALKFPDCVSINVMMVLQRFSSSSSMLWIVLLKTFSISCCRKSYALM